MPVVTKGGGSVSVVKPAAPRPAAPKPVKPPTIVHPAPVVVVPVVAVPVHHTHHSDDVSGWDVLGIILVFAVLLAVGWWAVDRWYR